MKRLIFAAAVLAAATPAARPAAADDPPVKGDLAKLQGTWSAKVGPEKNVLIVVTFKGSDVALKVSAPNGREYETTGAVKLDDQAKPHKTVDWVKFTNAMGEAVPENLGLYEFVDADTLRVCTGGPGNERPTEFKAGEGGPPQLFTLKRDQEKADKGKDKEEIKGDLARLQGEWTAKAGPEKNIPVTLTVKGRSVTLNFTTPQGEERTLKGEIVLNEAAKPKAIDWVKFTRPDGEEVPPNLGIYTLEGDEFTVCSGGPNNERPTEFKAGEGGPPQLVVFTRKGAGSK
jgi:uncharacterized protein (TIGR03067 family)